MATKKSKAKVEPTENAEQSTQQVEQGGADQEQEEQPKEKAEKVKLVHMVRDDEFDGKPVPPPYTADVHPSEVQNYTDGGWYRQN
jgi:hypothetical protein